MKLNFKEDPKEWRKSALMTALGLAILSTVLRWRHVLPANFWYAVLAALGIVVVCALLQPRWFRGYYRFSLRLGFYLSQFIGRGVLAVFFIFIVTPLGLVLRLAGKDPLQLKRPRDATTYWHQTKDCGPLDRLF
jgi:hypothetical protein